MNRTAEVTFKKKINENAKQKTNLDIITYETKRNVCNTGITFDVFFRIITVAIRQRIRSFSESRKIFLYRFQFR